MQDPTARSSHESTGEDTIEASALCLSGGGYRAMLFHTGTIWRLYETGVLESLACISSVSGGSITATVLALAWGDLSFAPGQVRTELVPRVVNPIRDLASHTLDIPAILTGALLPGPISNRIARSYRKRLFGRHTLQDLPDQPRFVINATNVQSGSLWSFQKSLMRDDRVGEVPHPELLLADTVAASTAFPPFLSPKILRLNPKTYRKASGSDLNFEPYTNRVMLSDGGVYDNLGLEVVQRFRTVLVSNAGGQMAAEARPAKNWIGHAVRVSSVVENQVRSLRKERLLDEYIGQQRSGAYWSIRGDIRDYPVDDALPCPYDRTLRLAETRTRLKRLPGFKQEQLINWGYAICDAAIRRFLDPALPPPRQFPYPDAGV